MQKSFSDLEYAAKEHLIRRGRFLAEIDDVTYGLSCISFSNSFILRFREPVAHRLG